jgi:LacI family transcriptional regulator
MTKNPPAKTAPDRKRGRATRQAGPVTLEMVAQTAGVSPSTVSRILNGTAVVSAAKKLAVDEAIAALGFVPNPVARGLAGGRTLSIGVVALSIDSPFYGVAMRGIEDELDRAGYSPLFVSGHWNVDEELRCIELLKARRVDGIIVLTGKLSATALRAQARTLPVVVTGRHLKAPGLCALGIDDEAGARLATQHLLDLGHRRIAFISGDIEHPDAEARMQGYLGAMRDAGLSPDPALIQQGDYHEAGGQHAVDRLLQGRQRFTAIFSANDQMAFGAALSLYRRGLRVPEDISLVGYDDLAVAQFSTPPLTTVHHAGYEMGQIAAMAMLSLLRGVKPTQQLAPPRLIVRESTRRLGG